VLANGDDFNAKPDFDQVWLSQAWANFGLTAWQKQAQ
jgi:hypothetical protein